MKKQIALYPLLLTICSLLITNYSLSQTGFKVDESGTNRLPNASAVLDAEATTKGILIPQLALTATNVSAPVTSPANSLLIFNTATAGVGATAVTPGFYYWDTLSDEWISVLDISKGSLIDSSEWIDGSLIGLPTGNIYSRKAFLNGDTNVIVGSGFRNGSIGIGVPSPNAKLHVKGFSIFESSSGPHLIMQNADGSKKAAFQINNSSLELTGAGNRFFINRLNSYNLSLQQGGGSVVIGQGATFPGRLTIEGLTDDATANALVVVDSNIANGYNTLLRVRNDGNVAVGSEAPLQKFHVANDKDATYDSAFVVTANGRVGIGLTNPAQRFEANGTGVFRKDGGIALRTISTAGTVGMDVSNGSTYMDFITPFNRWFLNRNTPTSLEMNYGGGVVIIGRSTGAAPGRLTVLGRTADATENAFVVSDSNQFFNKLFSVRNDGNVGVGNGAPQARFHVTIDENGVFDSAVVVTDQSRLGVGTLTPTERLDVIGNIRASGNFISGATTLTVPDYVFEAYFDGKSSIKEDYQFKSLQEIEDFTRVNKHLPGIPSAKEIKYKDKFNVTQSSLNNLEKIEELYLHLIQVNKEKDALKNEVESLKQELQEIKAMLNK